MYRKISFDLTCLKTIYVNVSYDTPEMFHLGSICICEINLVFVKQYERIRKQTVWKEKSLTTALWILKCAAWTNKLNSLWYTVKQKTGHEQKQTIFDI